MEEAKKRPRPRRSSAKAATEKMKQQRQTPQEKLISKIVTMGFNKEAVELAVYEEGYNESESIVMFLCENPKGYVERKQKKRSKKNEESAEAQTPSKIQPDKSLCTTSSSEKKKNISPTSRNDNRSSSSVEETCTNDLNEEEDQEEEQGKNENSIKKKKRKVIVTPIVVEENNLDKQLDIASSSLSSSSKKKSKRENSNKPNLNEKSLYKLLKKYRMKKANDSNIDKNNEEETRMFYILHSTVKAFLK